MEADNGRQVVRRHSRPFLRRDRPRNDYASALGYTLEYNKDPGPDVAVLLKSKHLRRWLKAIKEDGPRLPKRRLPGVPVSGALPAATRL